MSRLEPPRSPLMPVSLLRTPSPIDALRQLNLQKAQTALIAKENLEQGIAQAGGVKRKLELQPPSSIPQSHQDALMFEAPSLPPASKLRAVAPVATSTVRRTAAPVNTTAAGRLAAPTASSARKTTPTKPPIRTAAATAAQRTTAARPTATTTSRSTTRTAVAVSAPNTSSGKRQAWDVKGRLEDLEGLVTTLQQQLHSSETEVQVLQTEVVHKEEVVSGLAEVSTAMKEEINRRERELADTRRNRDELLSMMDSKDRTHRAEIDSYSHRLASVQADLDSALMRFRRSEESNSRLQATVTEQTLELETITKQLTETREALARYEALCREKGEKIKILDETLEEKELVIKQLEQKNREDEMIRRKLHNTILELKGNIRVFCRVRPILQGRDASIDDENSNLFDFLDNGRTLEIATPGMATVAGKPLPSKKAPFTFDKVFPPTSGQGQVFEEISQLVQSALDGYNTCIFTYGQTGSGKTYTMEGPSGVGSMHTAAAMDPNSPEHKNRGMIPRAVEQIFSSSVALMDKGWTYDYEAFFLEIYNESIRDLLQEKTSSSTSASSASHEIKHTADGVTTVTDLTVVKVEKPSQVYELLRRAAHNRAVAKTQCNERSSRSHSVFQLKIKGRNLITEEKATGHLNLIDLAGSERLAQSGSTGDRLKETQNINKSLSALGDVISALASKEAHIPYRNSKLTYLLQHSLGGNSKTLMFVNVSPLAKDLSETLSSLRFATKVNSCDIGTAKKLKT